MSRECKIEIALYIGDMQAELTATVAYSWAPAEYGAREAGTGLALEPDYRSYYEIEAVRVRGLDILPMLDNSMVLEIERLVSEQVGDA